MIKAIIVDDEQPAINKLVRLLDENNLTEVVGKYTKPLEALKFLQENKVDAVFLDIEMPEMDGIELASHIIDLQADIEIIFVTAYNKYAVEAFQLNALDYLMKPVTADRLNKALDKMIKNKAVHFRYKDIYVRSFGRFEVCNGTELVHFRTEKAEELLAYVIDRRGSFISRSIILDTLWGDFDGDRALINFNTTLHYLKKALIQYGISIIITYDRGGYNFDMNGVASDYLRFCSLIDSGKEPSTENISEFEETAAMFTGEYLSGWEYEWASVKRMVLTEQYIGLVLRLAEYYKDWEQYPNADRWLKAGLLKEPLHRELNYRLMEVLILMNEHALAARYYKIYKKGLYKKLGQEPDAMIQKLFSKIMNPLRA